jgi:Tfp pilus assembly protein PilF
LYTAAAALAQKNGNLEAAAQQYRKALQIDPKNRSALIGMARLQHGMGDMKGAIHTYREALNWYRDDAVIMNDLGLCHARNGERELAINVLRTAVQISPERPMYRNNLAAVLVEADRPEEALAYLAQAHGDAVAHYNVGYLLHQAGKNELAADYFSRSLEIDPSMQQARAMLGKITPMLSAIPREMMPHSFHNQSSGQRGTTGTPLQIPRPQHSDQSPPDAPTPRPSPWRIRSSEQSQGIFGVAPPGKPEGTGAQVSYESALATLPPKTTHANASHEERPRLRLPSMLRRDEVATSRGFFVPPSPKGGL